MKSDHPDLVWPSGLQRWTRTATRSKRAHQGFTLLELLVVVVIMGILLGIVAVRAFPSSEQQLRSEAEKLAQLFSAARDEARLRGAPIAWQADRQAYRFLALAQYNDLSSWTPITRDDILRPRNWTGEMPIQGQLIRQGGNEAKVNPNPETLLVIFGQEPIDTPFTLSLTRADLPGRWINIVADGLGHFTVITPPPSL